MPSASDDSHVVVNSWEKLERLLRSGSSTGLGGGTTGLAVVQAVADRTFVLDGEAQARQVADRAGREHEAALSAAQAGVEPRARRHLGLQHLAVVERHEHERHGAAAFIAHCE